MQASGEATVRGEGSPGGAVAGVGGGGFWASEAPKKGRIRAAFFARADYI